MRHSTNVSKAHELGVDAVRGHRLFEVKIGASAVRVVREGLLQLAAALDRSPDFEGHLVLPEVRITHERLVEEWTRVTQLLRPDLARRIHLSFRDGGGFRGIPRNLDSRALRVIEEVVRSEPSHRHSPPARGDAEFVIWKLLILQWIRSREPVTTEWLGRSSGHSYPTVSRVIRDLGGLIERTPDRRVRLRWLPAELMNRMHAKSDRARMTARFIDGSGHPRPIEAHVRRLEKLGPPDIAIGGVLGALHHLPQLDLTGPPRLDLSQHCSGRRLDTSFIVELDPALERVRDPEAPATIVVHAVRHAASFFEPRSGGLRWADPIECLLDLGEARLSRQANQFAEALARGREAGA